MATLMDFILNTLNSRINDPDNQKLWLPRLLVQMKGSDDQPALPVKSDLQNVGALEGPHSAYLAENLAENWGINNSLFAIPDPADPPPYLELSKIELDGLQNIHVNPALATADPVSLPLLFNAYTQTTGGVPMPTLTLSARYQLSQQVCSCANLGATVCDGVRKAKLTGDGDLTAQFTDCLLVADSVITVAGSGAARTLSLSVSKLNVKGADSDVPTINIANLTIDEGLPNKPDLIDTIIQALTASEGQAALLGALDSMLNKPANLKSINTMLTSKATDIFDAIFGPLPVQGLPADDSGQTAATPVDLFLFDRMRAATLDPASNWYLPWQLASSEDPVLEPYTQDRIDVPDQVIQGLKYTNITISNLVLNGGSNAQTPLGDTVLTTPKINATLHFGDMPQGPARQVNRKDGAVSMPVPPAPPLVLQADFALTQQGFAPLPLKGSLNATVTGLQAALTITPSGADADHLFLDISNLTGNIADATVKVTVQLDPRNDTLEGIMQSLFEMKSVQDSIAKALNQTLSDQSAQLSEQFSQIARNAIVSQLDN